VKPSTMLRRARRGAAAARDVVDRGLSGIGLADDPQKVITEAGDYWQGAGDDTWKNNSHWRDGGVFAGSDLWAQVGERHLDLVRRLTHHDGPWRRILEWGCGGGANAAAFAPLAGTFVGTDVSRDSLTECRRQVHAVTGTPFEAVLVDIDRPEAAALGEACDLFLCFYVFELLPSPAYAERILRIARRALAPGGQAVIQVKYDTGSFRTRSRRRSYRRGLADMTTFPIHEFWTLSEACGFRPEAVHLIPRNVLDERYAYFLLRTPSDTESDG